MQFLLLQHKQQHCCWRPTSTFPGNENTDAANEQHYEVNAAFYHLALGPRLKYSSGFWPKSDSTFEESEVAMLEMYCDRAKLEDGMKVRLAGAETGLAVSS